MKALCLACCLFANFHQKIFGWISYHLPVATFSNGQDCFSLVSLKPSLIRSYSILYVLFTNILVRINVHNGEVFCSYVEFIKCFLQQFLSICTNFGIHHRKVYVQKQNTCLIQCQRESSCLRLKSPHEDPLEITHIFNCIYKLNQSPVSVIMLQV